MHSRCCHSQKETTDQLQQRGGGRLEGEGREAGLEGNKRESGGPTALQADQSKEARYTSSDAFWIMPFTKGLLVNSTSPVILSRHLPLPSYRHAHCTF